MLKKSIFSPAQPRRAETRLSPSFVLPSFNVPTRGKGYSDSSRRVGENRYASGLHSLRPCWTNFLSILRDWIWPPQTYGHFMACH